ncbi:MAG: anti-sigma factor [Chloroflexi bacterium]|nr:anti-sigma factor [Chloroflexota bacterium]
MDCQEFEELVGEYALGITMDEDSEVALHHLTGCSNCQRLLREVQTVTDLLPLAVPEVETPPDMKARVFATIFAESPHTPISIQPNQPKSRRSWWQYWETRLVLACAILLFILLGGVTAWNISLQHQLTQIATSSTLATTVTIYDTTATAAASSGQLVYFPRLRVTSLIVHRLPQLSGTHVYQGWLIANGHPRSIGLLSVNGQDGTATLNFLGDLNGYQTVAISEEPGPQASEGAPKGPVIAMGSLDHTLVR